MDNCQLPAFGVTVTSTVNPQTGWRGGRDPLGTPLICLPCILGLSRELAHARAESEELLSSRPLPGDTLIAPAQVCPWPQNSPPGAQGQQQALTGPQRLFLGMRRWRWTIRLFPSMLKFSDLGIHRPEGRDSGDPSSPQAKLSSRSNLPSELASAPPVWPPWLGKLDYQVFKSNGPRGPSGVPNPGCRLPPAGQDHGQLCTWPAGLRLRLCDGRLLLPGLPESATLGPNELTLALKTTNTDTDGTFCRAFPWACSSTLYAVGSALNFSRKELPVCTLFFILLRLFLSCILLYHILPICLFFPQHLAKVSYLHLLRQVSR